MALRVVIMSVMYLLTNRIKHMQLSFHDLYNAHLTTRKPLQLVKLNYRLVDSEILRLTLLYLVFYVIVLLATLGQQASWKFYRVT